MATLRPSRRLAGWWLANTGTGVGRRLAGQRLTDSRTGADRRLAGWWLANTGTGAGRRLAGRRLTDSGTGAGRRLGLEGWKAEVLIKSLSQSGNKLFNQCFSATSLHASRFHKSRLEYDKMSHRALHCKVHLLGQFVLSQMWQKH